jgi:hypothetical protein
MRTKWDNRYNFPILYIILPVLIIHWCLESFLSTLEIKSRVLCKESALVWEQSSFYIEIDILRIFSLSEGHKLTSGCYICIFLGSEKIWGARPLIFWFVTQYSVVISNLGEISWVIQHGHWFLPACPDVGFREKQSLHRQSQQSWGEYKGGQQTHV